MLQHIIRIFSRYIQCAVEQEMFDVEKFSPLELTGNNFTLCETTITIVGQW